MDEVYAAETNEAPDGGRYGVRGGNPGSGLAGAARFRPRQRATTGLQNDRPDPAGEAFEAGLMGPALVATC
jgi:hypothetical protein